jgi:hypothetical protein
MPMANSWMIWCCELPFQLMTFDHRCTRFEHPGGGSVRFLPNFGGRVHLFGVLLHFYQQVLQKYWREGTLLSPPTPLCASMLLMFGKISKSFH